MVDDRALAARISGLYAGHFFGYGFFLPFFPLVLQARGVDPAHIGYVLGGAALVRILASPALSGLSDRSGRRRRSIFLFSVFGAFGLLLFLATENLFVMVLGVIVMTIFQAPIIPLSDAYALSAVKYRGLDYGRLRLWGSVSFVLANLSGGFIAQVAQGLWVVMGMLAGKILTGLVATVLPKPSNLMSEGEVSGNETSGLDTVKREDQKPGIFRQPIFLLFLVCLGLIEGSHAAYYGYSAIFFGRIGISDGFVGVLWAVGVIVEIGIFIVIGRVTARVSPLVLVQIGTVAAIVRWGLFPLADSLWPMFFLQALHGLTFAVAHVGSVRVVASLVPERWSATGQGFLASANGILMAAGMAVSGPLYDLNPAYPFWLMGLCAGLGGCGLLLLKPLVSASLTRE